MKRRNLSFLIIILISFCTFSQEKNKTQSETHVYKNGKVENGKFICNLFDWQINIPSCFIISTTEKSKERQNDSYSLVEDNTPNNEEITQISNQLISFETDINNLFVATYEPLKGTKRLTLEEHKVFITKTLEQSYSGKIKYEITSRNLKLGKYDFYKIVMLLYGPKTNKLVLTQIFYTAFFNEHSFSATIRFQDDSIGNMLEKNFIESFK